MHIRKKAGKDVKDVAKKTNAVLYFHNISTREQTITVLQIFPSMHLKRGISLVVLFLS